MKIVYIGLRGETLRILQQDPALQEAIFLPVKEAGPAVAREVFFSADIVLIGEDAENPVQLTQQVFSHDPDLSILIINDPLNFQKIKQALLFTPFIGHTVHCVSNAAGKGLAGVVLDHMQRSRQRRSYKKFRSSVAGVPLPSSQRFERVKEDYLNKILEEAPIGLVLINRNGIILSFNRYAAAFFGKSEREVLGSPLAALFPENDRKDLSYFFKQTPENSLQKTIGYQTEENPRFLEITLSKLEKEDPSYKIVLIKEVTDHILAQRSIEENAEKVRMIVDSMPEMAWTALPTGEIDYLNKGWYEFTGQKPTDSGTEWEMAIHPEDLPEVLSLWKEALRSGSLYQVECRYLKATDQKYCWHLTRARPVKNKEGKILHWVGTCTEIQNLKNTEEELQKAAEDLAAINEELRAANEEITASNEELFDTNERLIKVNEDLDNFIYTASHDLKAPITNIEGLVQILSGTINVEKEDTKVPGILSMIETSILRFKRTIEDLTEIVKLQRLSESEPELINVPDVIRETEFDLHQQIQEADAQLEILSEENAAVSFSHKNIKSVIYNLLSNAIKYRSPERKLRIKISHSVKEDLFMLSVQDNGLGMNIKDKEKVFGMFRRLHSHVEGTGIGLYIVKKIVDNAGGTIAIESQPGKGTTFILKFPLNGRKRGSSPVSDAQESL